MGGITLTPVDHNPFEITPDQAAMMPETYVNPLADSLIRGAVKTAMVPGQVYQSQQPITTEEMIKPAVDLAMMTTLGAGAMPAEADALRMGIKAYHGSPHDFDAFDMSKIGTGEGAQAYGHGLYFAESEPVARAYREKLSGQPVLEGDVDPFKDMPWLSSEQKGLMKWQLGEAEKLGLTGDDAVHYAGKKLSDMGANGNPHMRQAYYDAANAVYDLRGKNWSTSPGRMYEVNINADPEHFLDWDKPLSEQGPRIQNALPDILRENTLNDAELNHIMNTKTGQDAVYRIARPSYPIRADKSSPWGASGAKTYDEALAMVGGDKSRVNRVLTPDPVYTGQALRSSGIPGIKYLDQGSRASGEGSRNYVVFDDKLIDILRKYGLAGLSALPPATAAYLSQRVQPVDHDPFASGASLTPVDHDPFEQHT